MAKAKSTAAIEEPVVETTVEETVVSSEPVSEQMGFKPEDFQGAPSRDFISIELPVEATDPVQPIEPPVVI